MSLGPLFRREFRAATSGRRTFLYRVFVAVLLLLAAGVVGAMIFSIDPTREEDWDRTTVFGQAVRQRRES